MQPEETEEWSDVENGGMRSNQFQKEKRGREWKEALWKGDSWELSRTVEWHQTSDSGRPRNHKQDHHNETEVQQRKREDLKLTRKKKTNGTNYLPHAPVTLSWCLWLSFFGCQRVTVPVTPVHPDVVRLIPAPPYRKRIYEQITVSYRNSKLIIYFPP